MSEAAPREILVVDDERLIRTLLEKALTDRGFRVRLAADGEEALDCVRAAEPDLVLLDLMMPKRDGFGVLASLRADPQTRTLPIVVLTARATQEVLIEALDAGADDYISKPFHLNEVIARVRAHLRAADYKAQLERQERDGRILLDISHRLTSQLDLHAILREVTSMVADVLQTDRGSVVIFDPDGRSGRVAAASDNADLLDRPILVAAYPEIGRVLETRRPVIISDITADPLFDPVKDQLAGIDVRSAALFPMLEGETCIGVLFLRSKRPLEAFEERLVQFGQIVANAVGVAVTNARLFAAVKEESHRISHAREVVEQRLRFVQRFEDFFENSADGAFIVEPHGEVRYVNRRAESIVGHDRATLRGTALGALFDEVDRQSLSELLETADRLGRAPGRDVTLPDGRVLALVAARLPGATSISVTVRDVTEERRLAAALAETRDFLGSLIDASPNAVVATDLAGSVMVFNKAAEALFERPAETVVGQLPARALYPEGGAAEVIAAVRGPEHGGAGRLVPGLTREVINASGARVPVRLTAALVRVHERDAALVVVLEDQRDRLAMQAALDQTRERLEESEKMALLAELAGTTAHELNQPLTSVMGYAELLARQIEAADPRRKAVDTISREAGRMADIVKQIGRLTRYETKPYVGQARIIDLERSTVDSQEFEAIRVKREAETDATEPNKAPTSSSSPGDDPEPR